MRIPINRSRNKYIRKVSRKMVVAEAFRIRERKSVFEQLSPVDDARIRRRVSHELSGLVDNSVSGIGAILQRLDLCYKYAKEFTEGILF